jgi:hypothetical protein
MANLFMMGNHFRANVSFARGYLNNISFFGKRSYIFWIEAISQILFHFKDYIFLLFYFYIKCNINNLSEKPYDD